MSSRLLGALLLMLLTVTPAPAQPDTTTLREGDRVRVWSPESGYSGREFNLQRWQDSTLVLLEPEQAGSTALSWPQIDRLQVRRKSGGTNLWEGILIGGVAGVVAYVVDVNSTRTDQWLPNYLIVASRTLLPGVVVGGLVGSAIPEYEWVPVKVRGGHEQTPDRNSTVPGFFIQLQLPLPSSM